MKILLVTGCIFWALFDTHIVFGVRILDTCSPNGSKIAKYEFKDDRWFQIGQLYAFCMQYRNSSFDEDCLTTNCKNCMKSCPDDNFNLQSCIGKCNSSEPCVEGCQFFGTILSYLGVEHMALDNTKECTHHYSSHCLRAGYYGNTTNGAGNNGEHSVSIIYLHLTLACVYMTESSGIGGDTGNLPRVIQNASVVSDLPNVLNYQWQKIFSHNSSANLSSVYLVTTHMRGEMGLEVEMVLFLTTQTNYNVTREDFCARRGFIGFSSSGKSYRLNVYPINVNGWNRSIVLKGAFQRKKLPGVTSVNISLPYNYAVDTFRWTFQPVVEDPSISTGVSVDSYFQGERCRKHPQFLPRQRDYAELDAGDGSPPTLSVSYYVQNNKDNFDGCTSDVKFFALSSCLDSDAFVTTFTYVNCSMVKDYKVSCPWVEPITLPPDEEIFNNGKAVLSNVTCQQRRFTPNMQQNCTMGNYDLYVDWSVPKTYTPIKQYIVRWGRFAPFIFGNFYVPTTSQYEIGRSSTEQINTTLNIDMIFTEVGIEVHARTDRYPVFNIGKKKEEYIVYNAGLLSPTINLIITIKKSSESCSNWTFIPCFPGDTENNCERCTEGPGLEYTVTWERKDGSTGDDFLIKWGPGVLWTDRNVMVIPSGLSSEIIVPSNERTIQIRNIKDLVPDFGVKVEVNKVEYTREMYTSNYAFSKPGLAITDHSIFVQNVTCTNQTIIYDSHGSASVHCKHWNHDLVLDWKKPNTNRSVSYMVRWGTRNPRPLNENEALVLATSELGNSNTELLSQNIRDISMEQEIGIELHVKTRLIPNFPYSSKENGYLWYKSAKASLPNPVITQSIVIETKLVHACTHYKKTECFSGDIEMTCVQCQNGSVAYWVSWTAGERTRRMTTDSGQGRMFLLRWGGVVEHDGRQVIPLNSELGRLQTNGTSADLNISIIHPLMGFQVFELGLDDQFSMFSEDVAFVKIPPLDNPKTAKTAQHELNSGAIVVGILLPLIALLIIGLLFMAWRRRKKQQIKQFSFHNSDNNHGFYIYDTEVGLLADDWEITPKAITLDEKVGEGAFGTVYSATVDAIVIAKSKYGKNAGGISGFDTEHNPIVAVKLLKEGAAQDEWLDFKEEINLMKSIGYHKNIVNMIGCSTIKQPMCLLVEFMEHGDLLNFMRKRRTKLCAGTTANEGNTKSFIYTQKFQNTLQDIDSMGGETSADTPVYDDNVNPSEILTTDDLLSFAWQVSSGMEYLTEKGMVHRDLAARNVLVGANKVCKVSDFGLTRQVGESQMYLSKKSRKLPVKWMSVEAIFDQEFTTYSDVWAYGVLLFEIVTLGGTPYPSVSNRELLDLLKSGYRMGKPENCADPMYDIMLHCWNENPLERPNFTALRDHLDQIMSQSADYLTFDIDQENTYYNVASFNSVPSDDEDLMEIFESENAPKIMSVDELKEVKKHKSSPVLDKKLIDCPLPNTTTTNDKKQQDFISQHQVAMDEERYVQPQSLRSSMKQKVPQTNTAYVNTNFTSAMTDLTM